MLAAGWFATLPPVEKPCPGESVTRRVDRGPVHHAPVCPHTRRPTAPARGSSHGLPLPSPAGAALSDGRCAAGQRARGQWVSGQWASEQW